MITRMILLVVIGCCLLVNASLAMDVHLWNLPQPEDTQIIWQDRPFEINGRQGNATHLRSNKNLAELIDFYENLLRRQGWQLLQYYKEQNTLAFKKDEQFMYVLVIENGKDVPSDIYLASSPEDLAICVELKDYFLKDNLAPDVPGNDFIDVLRYPGAKRRMDVLMPEDAGFLLYETESKPREVAAFYEQALKSNGWDLSPAFRPAQLKKSGLEAQEFRVLLFEKGRDALLINITPLSYGENLQRTLITITKNISQELSASLLKEGE